MNIPEEKKLRKLLDILSGFIGDTSAHRQLGLSAHAHKQIQDIVRGDFDTMTYENKQQLIRAKSSAAKSAKEFALGLRSHVPNYCWGVSLRTRKVKKQRVRGLGCKR